MWNAYLEVARHNQARPEYCHDIARQDGVDSDEVGAEPESLNEHRHHDKFRETGSKAPDYTECSCSSTALGRCSREVRGFVRSGIEGFDSGNSANGLIDEHCG